MSACFQRRAFACLDGEIRHVDVCTRNECGAATRRHRGQRALAAHYDLYGSNTKCSSERQRERQKVLSVSIFQTQLALHLER